MARCRYCGRKGLFLSTDANGLCKNCGSAVVMAIQSQIRVLEDSIRLAEEGKTFKTRLSRCELAEERAQELRKYETMGIPTITPAPSSLGPQLQSMRDKIIIEEAEKVAEKSMAKAEVAATPRSKQTALSSALLKIQEILEHLADPSRGLGIIAVQKSQIHRATLSGFLEAAHKAEFKGNKKKALDQYQEALYFVLNDDIPDGEQKGVIAELESKIAELSP